MLYSIDSAEQFYRNPELPVGHCAIASYAELLGKRWHLIAGKDPADAMEAVDEKFDFCVIDTYHHHPVEVLNFISILPWLNDGAVVVMHDTTVFEWRSDATFLRMLSPRLLLSAVCAEKYIPNLPSGNMTASNIAAWQVNVDTRKYCQNLFDVLYLPWEVNIPKTTYQNIGELVSRHYPAELGEYYEEAVKINQSMLLAKQFGVLDFERGYRQLENDTVFYGAGFQMRRLLETLNLYGLEFPFQIWDRNAKRIKKVCGHDIQKPDFKTPAKTNQVMIVTIESDKIFREVCQQFEPLGYAVFHGLKEYLRFCEKKTGV